MWSSDRDYIESIDQFWECCHQNIKFSDAWTCNICPFTLIFNFCQWFSVMCRICFALLLLNLFYIFLNTIVNGIVLLISFLDCSLQVYRYAVDLLSSYPAMLLSFCVLLKCLHHSLTTSLIFWHDKMFWSHLVFSLSQPKFLPCT